MPDGPWLDEDEQRTWRSFLRMEVRLSGRLNRELQAASGMSEADFAVLVNLSEAPERSLRIFELASVLQWEKSRLSHHLSRMEQRGLVERRGCSSDGRGAFVVLTDEGFEAIEAAAPRHVEAVRKYFIDVLTPEQMTALDEISQAVLERLEVDE